MATRWNWVSPYWFLKNSTAYPTITAPRKGPSRLRIPPSRLISTM